jgi:hypothetical protein
VLPSQISTVCLQASDLENGVQDTEQEQVDDHEDENVDDENED